MTTTLSSRIKPSQEVMAAETSKPPVNPTDLSYLEDHVVLFHECQIYGNEWITVDSIPYGHPCPALHEHTAKIFLPVPSND